MKQNDPIRIFLTIVVWTLKVLILGAALVVLFPIVFPISLTVLEISSLALFFIIIGEGIKIYMGNKDEEE